MMREGPVSGGKRGCTQCLCMAQEAIYVVRSVR